MICPKCFRNSYFLTESNGIRAECGKCKFEGKYSEPSYRNYHDSRYSYMRVRDVENDPLLKKIAESNFIGTDSVVLDYGCGAGDYTNYFSKITKNVTGADINIVKARKRFPKVKFEKVNPAKKSLKFSEASFDVVIAVNVIEHVHDFENLLNEFYRILRINGSIFITTYDADFILHPIHNDPTHVFEWDKNEFVRFVSNKFCVVKSFSHGSFFNYYPWNKVIVKFLKPEICILAIKK